MEGLLRSSAFALTVVTHPLGSFPPPIEYEATSLKLKELFDFARRYPTAPSPKAEIEGKERVITEFCANLKTYETPDLGTAIVHFCNDNISSSLDFRIKNTADLGLAGRSSNSVFIIDGGETGYVVKAFRTPRKIPHEFITEVSALEFLRGLRLRHTSVITPLACARFVDREGEEWGLLLTTQAQGQRADSYVPPLKDTAVGIELFRRVGMSLGELHSARRSTTPGKIPEDNLRRYREKLDQILANGFISESLSTALASKSLGLDDFKRQIEQIEADGLLVDLFYTYAHGDAHLRNIFYDASTSSVTLIDLGQMHASKRLDGEPLMDGTADLLRFRWKFHHDAVDQDMSKEAETEFVTSLYDGYASQKEMPDERLVAFYTTYMRLADLVWYGQTRRIKETDPAKIKKNTKCFDDAVAHFAETVVKDPSL